MYYSDDSSSTPLCHVEQEESMALTATILTTRIPSPLLYTFMPIPLHQHTQIPQRCIITRLLSLRPSCRIPISDNRHTQIPPQCIITHLLCLRPLCHIPISDKLTYPSPYPYNRHDYSCANCRQKYTLYRFSLYFTIKLLWN